MTGIIAAIIAVRPTVTRRGRKRVPPRWCGAARGAAIGTTSAPPTGPTTTRCSRASTSGSGVLLPQENEFLVFWFLVFLVFLCGGSGGPPPASPAKRILWAVPGTGQRAVVCPKPGAPCLALDENLQKPLPAHPHLRQPLLGLSRRPLRQAGPRCRGQQRAEARWARGVLERGASRCHRRWGRDGAW